MPPQAGDVEIVQLGRTLADDSWLLVFVIFLQLEEKIAEESQMMSSLLKNTFGISNRFYIFQYPRIHKWCVSKNTFGISNHFYILPPKLTFDSFASVVSAFSSSIIDTTLQIGQSVLKHEISSIGNLFNFQDELIIFCIFKIFSHRPITFEA